LKPRPGYTKVIETDMVQVVEKLDDNDMIALSAYAGPEAQKASDQVRLPSEGNVVMAAPLKVRKFAVATCESPQGAKPGQTKCALGLSCWISHAGPSIWVEDP